MKQGGSISRETLWLDTWAKILQHIVPMIREVEKTRLEIAVAARERPDKAAVFAKISVEAQWWRYYEMSELRHFILAMLHVGLVPEMLRVVFKVIRARGAVSPILESIPHDDLEPRSPKRALGSAWSLGNTLRSFIICGKSLHALVARAARDSEAFHLAVRIDPLTLYCETLRSRMVRAVAEHDVAFLHAVGEALQNPKTLVSEQYGELQVCLLLLLRARQLPYLNESRAEQLFLVRLADLRLYQSDRRSLIRFIQRFKDKAATKSP